jgi:DNA-binding transcriptional LysR family regulator
LSRGIPILYPLQNAIVSRFYDRSFYSMELIDLKVITAVIEDLSILTAARRLKLSQSAVTRRLQNIESELGTPLILRDSRPVKPTKEGAAAYQRARKILLEVDELTEAYRPDAPPTGEFRIGISAALGESMLFHPIECLYREFKKLWVSVSAGTSPQMIERVKMRELDVAIVVAPSGTPFPEPLVGELVSTQPVLLVVSKTQSVAATVNLEDLARFSWILNPKACFMRESLRSELAMRGIDPHVVTSSANNELKLMLLQQCSAIGMFLPPTIRDSGHRRQVKVLKVADFHPKVDVWLVHLPDIGKRNGALKCVQQAIKRHFRD